MQSRGNAPTAAQKRWYEWVASSGCIICGSLAVELHHVAGSSAKSQKVKIGNWYILPLTFWHHRDQANPSNVDLWKKRFEAEHGSQKDLFCKLVDKYADEHDGKMPFSDEIYEAIMRY